MGKYDAFRQERKKKPNVIHPIWRGIGFVLMILTPILGYFGTSLLLSLNKENGWFAIPGDLIARGSEPYLYIKILGTFLFVFIFYAIFMFVTFLVYRIFGPGRLGPEDAPQVAFRGRTHRR